MENIVELQIVLASFEVEDENLVETNEGESTLETHKNMSEASKRGKGPKIFDQDDVNKFLADDRRKHQQKYEQLETAYKDALENQNLSTEQREQIENKLDEVQKMFRSKEEQLKHENRQWEEKYSKEVKEWETKATSWEQKYRETVIARSLQDAAVAHDAFRPSQVIALLRPMTKIVERTDEQGKGTGELVSVVDLMDIDTTTGEPIITRRTPEDAVKRMKELPEEYGNLFKANVVSGVGAGSATGSANPGSGRIDPRKLTMDQYVKLRKENPSALGLKR
jgi:ribosomal protein L14E/L6E/L27E